MNFYRGQETNIGDKIFVFGSNLRGLHGKGAAKTAVDHFGAVMWKSSGLQGRSYAIPTKDHLLRSLPLDVIEMYVDTFIQYTIDHPEKKFYLTPIGTGYAGYTHAEIAPLFIYAKNAENIWFPLCWKPYLF